jgi:hypothetical protein
MDANPVVADRAKPIRTPLSSVPTFLNQPLLWGLGLVAVPVLIHLINMLRHKRVPWAAMEFLLASQRKHSTWIRLKELLLLLLRMAAVAAVVLIVARPRFDGGLGGFGDGVTHHIVLVDDSFSMADRFGERSVFDAAKQAVEQIAQRALNESSAQTFTLLRASRAAIGGTAKPDLFAETVNSDLVLRDRNDRKLNRILAGFRPSDLADGPEACLAGLGTLLKANDAEERILYLVSDFRAHDWRESDELRSRLAAAEKKVAQIYFVNCADADRPNLAVAALRPESGTRAAGVHFFMQVEVQNFGRGEVENVPVEIRTDGDAGGVIFLDKIEAGRTAVARFPVFFSNPGEHTVAVSLEPDSVEADNRRYAALDLAAEIPVLIVDGAADNSTGRRVAEALAPPGPVRSGLAPKLHPPSFLNDNENNPFAGFRTAFLCNIERLDEAAVRNLEQFVASGGGVCFIVGDRTDPAFFNAALYRDGKGLFPAPLDGEKPLFRAAGSTKAADIARSNHAVFRAFAVEQNSYLYDVTIDKYYGLAQDWTPEVGSRQGAAVIATLRNGAPLAVDKSFGQGRVAALLALPIAPHSDWARNVSFVITMLEMQGYLAPHGVDGDDRRVGTPLVLVGDAAEFRPAARVLPPGIAESAAVTLQATAGPEGLRWEFDDTAAAGFYRVERTHLDDTTTVRTVPLNVDPREGDPARFVEAELRERLGSIRFHYRTAERFLPAENEAGASFLSTWILYLLAAVLLGEQALAYSASYHPPRKGARA